MLWILCVIISSYLIGSIPTAYLFGRAVKGIDIRKHGSGNVGATNAFRVLGKKWGVIVFIIDVLKGLVPVLVFGQLLTNVAVPVPDGAVLILIGLACVAGHNWTVFLRFNGGKGVATSLGILIAFGVSIGGFAVLIGVGIIAWTAVFLLSGIVSLASVIAAVIIPAAALIFKQPLEISFALCALAVFIVYRHIPNIRRIFKGEEKRLCLFRKSPA